MSLIRPSNEEFEKALRERYLYNPITGELRLKRLDRPVGSVNPDGYLYFAVTIRNYQKFYFVHRAAWFLLTGSWPQGPIDHANHEPGDNHWINLRLATPSQNVSNTRDREGPLPRGVWRNGRNYQAVLQVNRKRHHLGTYKSPEEAKAVYEEAFKRLVGSEWRADDA